MIGLFQIANVIVILIFLSLETVPLTVEWVMFIEVKDCLYKFLYMKLQGWIEILPSSEVPRALLIMLSWILGIGHQYIDLMFYSSLDWKRKWVLLVRSLWSRHLENRVIARCFVQTISQPLLVTREMIETVNNQVIRALITFLISEGVEFLGRVNFCALRCERSTRESHFVRIDIELIDSYSWTRRTIDFNTAL